MPEYTLEPANIGDIHAIVRIVNDAYRGNDGKVGWTSEMGLVQGQRVNTSVISRMLRQENPKIYVMRDKQTRRIVATICLDRFSPVATEIGMLSVDVELQGSGLGKRILAATEDRLRSVGCLNARMSVIEARTELVAWYVRRGFLPTGDYIDFPYDDESVGIPLRDGLRFIVLEKILN
ncbi:GNAT family N-acetyltransferase [Cupriavidus plantarum]|uniref:GNAT family N-acetyltransferase n=1 Tax=Cupriavidus plantarum TaxID=942865 RepID=UPI0015C8B219|nr:GNAT family N-acetyltransferase [Cupriavidus plantarum]NYI02752.1 GNAT superfamily N-acetyltransferase [Cupriavidus plantarum]